MFKIDLPKMAVLNVALPTGGMAAFVHLGEGRFLSGLPPVMLAGVSLEAEATHEGLPVEWDGSVFPAGCEAHPVAFVFDALGAQRSVEAAAAAGDLGAAAMLEQIHAAEKQLAAQVAVGMVPADAEVAADTQGAA